MNRILICFFLLAALSSHAHLGTPNVLVDGQAGPYEVRVVIKPPTVIPGLAEITVRLHSDQAKKILVLPVFWKTGKKGSPAPDEAEPVPGETNLYAATLWFMSAGTYLVEITVEGQKGAGSLMVPVNAMATNTRPMTKPYALVLGLLAFLLFVGAGKIASAIFRDSLLTPGTIPARRDLWRGRIMTSVVFLIILAAAWGGKIWWEFEESEYRNNRLYAPMPVRAETFATNNTRALRLAVDDSNHRGKWTPLIPDHGKMMHLFLVRQPDSRVFAHLHPRLLAKRKFEVVLPPLPAGNYTAYGDVTHENGFSETLTAEISLPDPLPGSFLARPPSSSEVFCSSPLAGNFSTNSGFFADPDDSWHISRTGVLPQDQPSAAEGERAEQVGGEWAMIWENAAPLRVNRESTLLFRLRTPLNSTASIQYYMGMAGHLILRSKDGKVFSHIHPDGNYSMAAQQFFAAKNQTSPVGTRKDSGQMGFKNALAGTSTVGFPCAFPQAGDYRIWVQLKSQGRVFTGVFDIVVAER